MRRLILPLVLVSALVVAGAGLVRSQTADAAKAQGAGRGSLLRAAAQYVGVTPRELVRELRSGRSLAQVAQAHGKTREGLKAALLQTVRARLDRALAAGRITTAQHAQRLARAERLLDRLIDRTNLRLGHQRLRAVLLRVAAGYLGMPPRELVRELRAGRSLAEVASARGKTRAGLKAALLAAVEARLDRRVAAGRMTPERKAAVLARVSERIERLLDRKRAR